MGDPPSSPPVRSSIFVFTTGPARGSVFGPTSRCGPEFSAPRSPAAFRHHRYRGCFPPPLFGVFRRVSSLVVGERASTFSPFDPASGGDGRGSGHGGTTRGTGCAAHGARSLEKSHNSGMTSRWVKHSPNLKLVKSSQVVEVGCNRLEEARSWVNL